MGGIYVTPSFRQLHYCLCVCMRGADMSNDVNKTFSSNFEPSKLFYIKLEKIHL